MMGERRVMQEALFYGFSLERHVPDNHLLRKIDRFVDLSEVRAHLGPYYSDVGSALDRSRADDPDADRRLLLRHSLGAAAVRRGPPQSGLSLVLSIGARRRRPRSFDLLQEPPRPFPRERSPAQAVRDRGGALHEGRDRGRRSLRGRRQHHRGRRPSPARRRQDRGPRSDLQSGSRGISVGSR